MDDMSSDKYDGVSIESYAVISNRATLSLAMDRVSVIRESLCGEI